MSQPFHLDARIWNEDRNNEAVILQFQPLPLATIDDLINELLQLQFYWCPLNLHLEEVYVSPSSEGYLLPLMRYKGHIDPLNI